VVLKAQRAADDPKVFTRIEMQFIVRGRGLKQDVVERAARLSHEKYCSASVMLEKSRAACLHGRNCRRPVGCDQT